MVAVRGDADVIEAVRAETASPWRPASATSRSTPWSLSVADATRLSAGPSIRCAKVSG